MATNEATTLRNAIILALESDPQLQAICGRTTGIVVIWQSIAIADRPVLAYLLASSVRIGGLGHRRQMLVLLGAYAIGNGAQDEAEAMTRRAREVLTVAKLSQYGVEGVVMSAPERSIESLTESGSQAQESRLDLELLIEMAAPL